MHSSHGKSPPKYWEASAIKSADADTAAIAAGTAQGRPERALRMAREPVAMGRLEEISGGEDAARDQQQESGGDRGQIALDEGADRGAESFEERGHQEEPRAARGDRGQGEDEQVEMGDAAGDGDELIGDRGEAFDQDDPQAPSVIGVGELGEGVLMAVERKQRPPYRLVQ